MGVYASTNGGSTWGEFRTGMPYAIIFDLTYVPVGRKLRATTHGNGIWERKLLATPVAIQNENPETPKEFSLSQNYPNPFNPVTTIRFTIPSTLSFPNASIGNPVSLMVYDLSGKEIATLINESLTPGSYSINFDAGNLSSGIYFYTLQSINFKQSKRMILIK